MLLRSKPISPPCYFCLVYLNWTQIPINVHSSWLRISPFSFSKHTYQHHICKAVPVFLVHNQPKNRTHIGMKRFRCFKSKNLLHFVYPLTNRQLTSSSDYYLCTSLLSCSICLPENCLHWYPKLEIHHWFTSASCYILLYTVQYLHTQLILSTLST